MSVIDASVRYRQSLPPVEAVITLS